MYSILPLVQRYHAQALKFICGEFVEGSPLHLATGVTYEEYLDYMREPFNAMVTQGLSFIAIDDVGSLGGCLLAGDVAVSCENTSIVPESIMPIKKLLVELECSYLKNLSPRAGEVLMVDIAVVATKARKQGLYRKLRNRVHQEANNRGFKAVIGELSSAATQHFCINKLGHKAVSEVRYSTFEYEGEFPFAGIKQPAGIVLVEGVPGNDPDGGVMASPKCV